MKFLDCWENKRLTAKMQKKKKPGKKGMRGGGMRGLYPAAVQSRVTSATGSEVRGNPILEKGDEDTQGLAGAAGGWKRLPFR